MREHDYTTLFKLEHMLKDVRLCLEEARARSASRSRSPTLRASCSTPPQGRGRGDDDFAAVIEVDRGRSGHGAYSGAAVSRKARCVCRDILGFRSSA